MPIRSVASGILQSKDGTHIEVAALTAPVTAHATIGAHVPESCVAVRGLRRRPKQGTAASLVKAAAVAGAKSRSLCRKPSYPAALVGLHGRSVPFAHRRGTVPAAPCLQCLALGRVRPPKRNVGDRTAVAICRVDFYFGLCARLGRRSLDSYLLAALLCRWPWRGWSAPPQPPASRIFARRKRLSLPTIRRVVIARREQTARKQREERCPTATARRQSMK